MDMKLRRVTWFLCVFLLAGFAHGGALPESRAEHRDGYDYYAIGDTHAKRPGAVSRGYMLNGGGRWIPDSFKWFAERAGHGHLVILRASGADDLQRDVFKELGGFASAQTLVFHDRAPADDPGVLDIVKHADAIFFGGGDQSRYVRFWKGTALNAALNAHVKAGKPIGGTSAGLAILGAYSYGAMDGGSLVSRDALADPSGAHVTLVKDFLHLPLMEKIITDTHFAKRDRFGRLITFLARLILEERDTAITGIAVDEDSSLCVDAQGIGRLYTVSGGFAWLIRPLHAPATLVAGKPLDFDAIPIIAAGPGSRVDLKRFAVERPAFAYSVSVKNGVLLGNERTPAARLSPVPRWSLAVHGGAGVINKGDLTPQREAALRAGLNAALEAGSKVLRAGGSSVDAVEAAVKVLEDDPLFNAGRGAVFSAAGRNELDASIMDGRTRAAGAVASVTRTRNPVSLARAVMETSPHVMLAGEGADEFSRLRGLPQVDPSWFRTEERWQQYQEWRAAQDQAQGGVGGNGKGAGNGTWTPRDRTHLYGTVGAVALDQDGHLAAATSTGGLTGKRWGRIGDSPVIGAGTYAEDGLVAVSATGTGEYFIRSSAARQVRDLMEYTEEGVQDALDDTIEDIEIMGGDGALMGMDGSGQPAFGMNSIGLYRGAVSSTQKAGTAIYAGEALK
jgi:L-asparaginase / beta-aspartyl-peptidase